MRPLVDIDAVSTYLDIPIGTLRNWRVASYGPTAYKVGKHLRYDMAEVRRWVRDQARVDDATPLVALDPYRFAEALSELLRIRGDDAEEQLDTVIGCNHAYWTETDDDREYACQHCGASPKLLALLGLAAEVQPCGHTLDTPELLDGLAVHVTAAEIGEGSFWSCAVDMPGWNDDEDEPAPSCGCISPSAA